MKSKEKLYRLYHKKTAHQQKFIKSNNFTYKHIIKYIDKYIKPNDTILDIGCGAGTLALYYTNKSHKVFGIDLDKSAIGACRESVSLLGLKKVSFDVVSFPDESPRGKYDFIILSEVIEHIHDDLFALKKIYSLLNNGGILFLSTPSKNDPLYKLGLANKHDKAVGHLRRYSVDELTIKCRKAGFNVLEINKNQGIIRTFLFINPVAGQLIRFFKYFISDFVTFVDSISLRLFGESDLIFILKKR